MHIFRFSGHSPVSPFCGSRLIHKQVPRDLLHMLYSEVFLKKYTHIMSFMIIQGLYFGRSNQIVKNEILSV